MDVLAVYGPMLVAAVICGLVGIAISVVTVHGRITVSYKFPSRWNKVADVTALAVPFAAFGGAAALVGPSTDLVNFIKGVGAVLAGLVLYGFFVERGLPEPPEPYKIVLKDGRVLVGPDAVQHYYNVLESTSWGPHYEPSPRWVARFAFYVCIQPPIAGVFVSFLIALL